MKSLPVKHPNGQYDIYVEKEILPNIRELAQIEGKIAVVTDETVAPLHLAKLPNPDIVITIHSGELHKNLETVSTVYTELLNQGADRQTTIVALGGGVVGDLAGYVAASYMRGVPFVQCPTTLLAMVDSSVGGKTGVDLPQGKNLVGAFKQPTAVLADLITLQTLPYSELHAGMAEVVKHGLIANPALFEHISKGEWRPPHDDASFSQWRKLVLDAIQVKRDVVQEDPYEQGRRATLNLGHTFGHAIEQVSQYAIRHGEGVAMGLMAAGRLSADLGYCPADLPARIEQTLMQLTLPTRIPKQYSPAQLYEAMGSDKKKVSGKLRFILLRDVGDVFVTDDVPREAVLEAIEAVQ